MGFIILDGETVKRLESARETMEIRDEVGRTVGIFQPATETLSASSRTELEAQRQDRSGRRLDEVINELRRK